MHRPTRAPYPSIADEQNTAQMIENNQSRYTLSVNFDHCASAPLWEEFFEAHGYGPNAEDDPAAVINAMIEVVRFGGGTGIPGIYTAGDT
jgi:hypothetical protein